MASAAFHPLDPRGARQRLVCAVLFGALAWFALPDELSVAIRALAAWDAAALTLLGIAWWIILAYLAHTKPFPRSAVLSSWKRLGLGYGLNHRG